MFGTLSDFTAFPREMLSTVNQQKVTVKSLRIAKSANIKHAKVLIE